MINNEFHLIGTAVSDFKEISNKRFAMYGLMIEVEKFGGNHFETEVIVYNNNNRVDVKQRIYGQQIAVNGYIDTMTLPDNSIKTKLIVQNILILNKKKVFNNAQTQEHAQPQTQKEDTEVDDDLPF